MEFSEKSLFIDTSIWIDLFEKGNDAINRLIMGPSVCCHPFVIGEISVGNLGNRNEFISALHTIRQLNIIPEMKVLKFIREKKLYGRGIGYIDCHLLASVISVPHTVVWTIDKKFHSAASQLGVAYTSDVAIEKFFQ